MRVVATVPLGVADSELAPALSVWDDGAVTPYWQELEPNAVVYRYCWDHQKAGAHPECAALAPRTWEGDQA